VGFAVKELQEPEIEREVKLLPSFSVKSSKCIIPTRKSSEGEGQRAVASLEHFSWFGLILCFFFMLGFIF